MTSKKTIVPRVGARLLVHAPQISATIWEGTVREVSTNGKLFNFGADWMTLEHVGLGVNPGDPLFVEILDELPPKSVRQEVLENEEEQIKSLQDDPGPKKVLFVEKARLDMGNGNWRTFEAGEMYEFQDVDLIREIVQEKAGKLL